MQKLADSGPEIELQSYLAECREALDRRLARLRDEAEIPAPLQPPVAAALASVGKRVRGILTMAAGESCGLSPVRLIDAAAAFEMIHASSLILDDLPSMDDAEFRRGEPALHRKFGEDLAILTSVALLNHAYGLLGTAHETIAPRRWNLQKVVQQVVEAVGWDGTIGGEAVDLHSEASRLDFQTLEYIHSRKTGRLFVAAATTGAMLANASESLVRVIEAYAKNLGLAFQITDDILDATATREQLGKDVGKDASKLTFVKLAGIEGARQLTRELIDTSLASLEPLGASGRKLRLLAAFVRDRTR
ncbi:MAG TPA: polyprenyl synthetase family protein [Thermoanaerobaculia bacterium]|nr:polyprenyl synthetase family protein [Thermoanaerobaculia bacterium]